MSNKEAELLHKAFQLHRQGQLTEAASIYELLIRNNAQNHEAIHLLGVIKTNVGEYHEARRLMERSLESKTANPQFLDNYANLLFMMGEHQEAVRVCSQTREAGGKTPVLRYVLAVSLYKLGRLEESRKEFADLLSLQPEHLAANNEMGSVLSELEQYSEALAYIEKALKLNPRYAPALLNKGNILGKTEKLQEALACYHDAISADASLHDAHLGAGNVLGKMHRSAEALAAYNRALSIQPDVEGAWLGRGNILAAQKKFDEALLAYDRALSIKPDLIAGWFGRGTVLRKLDRFRESSEAFARIMQIAPDHDFIKGVCLHARMLCCDWSSFDAAREDIEAEILAGRKSAEPFGWQGLSESEQSLQLCARTWNRACYGPAEPLRPMEKRSARDDQRIRIGYVSGEFREQATSHLIVGLLELHDKAKFQIVGFDNGWDDSSAIRSRINKAIDKIVSIQKLDDTTAVHAVRNEEIDILVNLNGYFGEERTRIFAYRPAPVQVNYLGFPGTLGADYFDYIVADRIVLPPEKGQFYDEKVIYLPYSYQVNDRSRLISEPTPSREEAGLPADAFVYCCFNNNYKILPATFDSWMRILQRTGNSVLWLLRNDKFSEANLRSEAQRRGVDPARIVFAGFAEPSEHLARHRLADLFLDTLPYNAHTTASDALWAGLPLLTLTGTTFAGRVATSLLHAIDLQELVASSREEYEAMAVELAVHRSRLQAIKDKLEKNRLTRPLFDTALYAKHIEAAYEAIHRKYQAGLPADTVEIGAGV